MHQLIAAEEALHETLTNADAFGRYADTATNARYEAFRNDEARRYTTTANMLLLALIALAFAILVVQRAANDRHAWTTRFDALALALLVGAMCLVALRVVVLAKADRLMHQAADTAVFLATSVMTAFALVLAPRNVISNNPRCLSTPMFVAGWLLTARVHWAPQTVTISIHAAVFMIADTFFITDHDELPLRVGGLVLWVGLVALAGRALYKAQRRRFALAVLQERTIELAERNTIAQRQLLQAVVPDALAQSTLDCVAAMLASQQTSSRVTFGHHTMVAAHVALRPGNPTRVGECLRALGAAVGALRDDASSERILELASITGDAALIAGPFIRRDDDALTLAALDVVVLLGRLDATFAQLGAAFTAAADVDWGFGALVGVHNRIYSLLGPVTLHTSAIAAAAPEAMPGAPLQSTTFVTCSFALTAGFSCANPDATSELFGTEASWKVRGVGRLRVHPLMFREDALSSSGVVADDGGDGHDAFREDVPCRTADDADNRHHASAGVPY